MEHKPTHPAAEIFPIMEGAEFAALVADIQEHGLREPIILHDGMILDGRNRYRACMQISMPPKFQPWDQAGTPEAFVVSMNLHRRHLNTSQRALIAARLANIEIGAVGGGHEKAEGQNRLSDASALLNVGRTSIVQAKKVLSRGTEEEIDAIERGEARVDTVAKQIRQGMQNKQRKKKRAEPLAQAGKNPTRIEGQRIRAEIWGRVRDTLIHLTSLPTTADVVRIVREMDKAGLVDAKLEVSLQYLQEFAHGWRNRNQNVA